VIVHARRAAAILFRAVRTRGDRRPYLVPAAVCPAVPLAILAAGGTVDAIDLDGRLAIDREQVLARLAASPDRYAGLVYIRPYGDERDPAAFFAAVREKAPGLLVIDDRCLGYPDVEALHLTRGADLSLFSTSPRKQVDLGWGGFAHLAPGLELRHVDRPFAPEAALELERETRRAVAEGRPPTGIDGPWLDLGEPGEEWSGYAARVVAARQEQRPRRERLGAIYRQLVPLRFQLAEPFQVWRFNVAVPEPDRLVARLATEGLFAGRHYAPLAAALGDHRPVPRAAALHAAVVNLFVDEHSDERRAERAAVLVTEHGERAARGMRWPPPALRPAMAIDVG